MKTLYPLFFLLILAIHVSGAVPAGYYSTLEGKKLPT
jgi:hypothetical protein